MPHVFDGNNNYGSSVFVRYKHRADATEEKIGLKVGENKNMLVKDYQDLMISKGFSINNEETIREITTFVKHTTNAGNVRYAADIGHDDTVMTIINTTSIFPKNEFKEMVAFHNIDLPQNLSAGWSEETITAMAEVSYALPHMWTHALGYDWKEKITLDDMKDLFRRL